MIKAKLEGDLRQIMESRIEAMGLAATDAVAEAAERLKETLRAQTVEAGLGERLARTWRTKLYPNGYSLRAAALVYSKAPVLLSVFATGAVIRGRDGLWLAVPLPTAPKRVMGKRVTPGLLERAWGIRLRFVFRRGKPSLLVADGMRAGTGKRGGFRKASDKALATGVGLTSVPMFVLVPQVALKKRLDIEAAKASAAATLAAALLRNVKRT